ncbi:MAG TPA: CpaF/VirB11 family protein [Bacteriovoracaceae bacterium]|nr:CpaF/VirB11 family protein [Bacteriovoracaceae bacterium]
MLSLFREQESPLKSDEALVHARRLLNSSLNKGIIPSWNEFFQELPALGGIEDLERVKNHFCELTERPFLKDILSLSGNEYFFHAKDSSQRLTPEGIKESISIPIDEEDWQLWLEILSVQFNQNWNVQNPFVSFYAELFGRNYRLSLIHGSTSPHNISKLMVRSLSQTPHPLDSFGESDVMKQLVLEKRNFMIAGSTGSGKTSLLTSLIELVDPDEHLVILEDTFEIMSPHPHLTRMLAGDTLQTSLKSYLAYSLRLSPDRIILGEMRSHEAVPFVMAMNTGHKGLMGTVHASSAVDALNRVALLFSIYGGEANLNFEKVMELLCRNLEYIVFMEKKKIKEIIKILGSDKGIPFFETIFYQPPPAEVTQRHN